MIEFHCTDVLTYLHKCPSESVDLVFGSPPYEDVRTYGIDFKLKGQQWVDWMVEVVQESVRVSRGLVAFVVAGKTKSYRWSATPVLLMADLHRAGVCLRNPPIFHRVGIPGSGGPDWLRSDYEFIVCATSGGKLPWSDNTACGHPPKWAPGGEMSHRVSDGARVNQWGNKVKNPMAARNRNGKLTSSVKPSHRVVTKRKKYRDGVGKFHTKARADGMEEQFYVPPVKANPGNVLHYKVGGGLMGSRLAHENEAPFPEKLARFFIKSFCPPGGCVLDPFSGSGTTMAVADRLGRNGIGLDVRQSQIDLSQKRLAESQKERANRLGVIDD